MTPKFEPGLHVTAGRPVDISAYDSYIGRWSRLFVPAVLTAAEVVVGEGFRMPAIAGGPCEDGPAYGNRPSTNPRGAGARLWGFEDSAATV